MNSKVWIKKALSMCLVVATMATYSMATLANSERIAGALSVSGKNINGEAAFVKVNGEVAQTGRSIFSSSTIATPADANAVIDLGKTGKIQLAPNTILALSFTEKGISGDLSTGQVTVLSASDAVSIKTVDGKVVKLNAGDSAVATTGKTQDKDDDDTTSDGGSGWLLFAGILGGAAVAIIIAANSDNNRIALGGSTTVISPSR